MDFSSFFLKFFWLTCNTYFMGYNAIFWQAFIAWIDQIKQLALPFPYLLALFAVWELFSSISAYIAEYWLVNYSQPTVLWNTKTYFFCSVIGYPTSLFPPFSDSSNHYQVQMDFNYFTWLHLIWRRERIFHSLLPQNACYNQGWARLKPETRNSLQISHVHVLKPCSAASQYCPLAGSLFGWEELGLEPVLQMGCRHPTWCLKCRTKCTP